MQFTVVITVHEGDCKFLPHALDCLMNQKFKDFNLIIMVDGESLSYDPVKASHNSVPAEVHYTPKTNTCGFRQRNLSLPYCTGEYSVWLNVDNLIYSNYLANHYSNIKKMPGCISVVNLHYWHQDNYYDHLPKGFTCGGIDLLNYALPSELARKIDAFGRDIENQSVADWLTLQQAMQHAPVVWHKDQELCGAHF